jgi:AcrR family transcriptional regulator
MTGVTRRRRANVRGASSREGILSAAERQFAELGWRGVSTASIAAAAGISESGLLHHFCSKNGLLKSLLELRYAFDESKFLADESLEGLALFPLLVRLVGENTRQRGSVKLTMVILAEGIRPSHPAHAYFRRRYARAREILGGHLERARHGGYLRRDVDPHGLAAVLLAAMDGLQLQWLIDPGFDMASSFELLARILVDAVAPVPKSPRRKTNEART